MSAKTRADLDAAIRAHSAEEWGGDLVVDWILVAGLAGVQFESSIGIEESRDNMPAYISNGLLHEAMKIGDGYEMEDND